MPDITQIQVGSTTYDIRDTNVALKAHVILSSASGSIASFSDGFPAPMTALNVAIDPVQDLHGYDNPWPAGGGANQWDEQWELGGINSSGNNTDSTTTIRSTNYIPVTAGQNYYIVSPNNLYVWGYDSNKAYVQRVPSADGVKNTSITIPEGISYLRFIVYITTYGNNISINYPSTVTTYQPYSNICPISGRTSATVTRTGKNLCNAVSSNSLYYSSYTNYTIDDTTGKVTVTGNSLFGFIASVKPNQTYTYSLVKTSGNTNSIQLRIREYSSYPTSFDGSNYIQQTVGSYVEADGKQTLNITTTAKTQYILVSVYRNGSTNMVLSDFQLELGSTASAYEAPNIQTVTIDLDGTRYGGTLDVLTGELTVTHGICTIDNFSSVNQAVSAAGLHWADYNATNVTKNGNSWCSMLVRKDGDPGWASTIPCYAFAENLRVRVYCKESNITDFKNTYSDLQFVYPLANSITVQLNPQQINTLLGENHIWADTGDISVEYRADTKRFIEEHSKAKRPYYVKGTQTSSTGSWTGNLPDIDALYEGLIIDYWLPYAGSGNATLNLTLKGGVTSGAINMYYGGTTRLTTHLPALCVGQFIYQTVTISGTNYTGWWYLRSYDSGNTTDIVNLYQGSGAYQANSAVYRYQLLFQMDENKLTPLNNNNNVTGTTKTMLTDVEFDPFGYIFYYNSTTTVNANGNMTTTLYYQRNGVDLRYTFNCGQTLTAHKMLYLVLSLQSNGKVKIANATPWTHDLPTTNDGYLYLLLGRTYSTYQFALFKEHPIYYHNGTDLIEYTKFSKPTTSTPGLMLEAPSDDNEYMRKNSEWTKPLLGNLAFMNSNNGIEIFMITK